MTAVNVAMFSPASGPDLANATAAEVIAAIMKAFLTSPFVLESTPTCNPYAVKPSQVNAWLVAHGCRRFRFEHFVHDQFELVEVKP